MTGSKISRLISVLGRSPYVLAVYPGMPAKNVAELVALAKAKRSLEQCCVRDDEPRLFGQRVIRAGGRHQTERDTLSVLCSGGLDVVAGRVEMQFSTLPPAVPLIREGKLRALATTGAQRFSTLSEVPTLAESGFAEFDVALWLGMAAPAGTPPKIIARLNSEVVALLNTAEMRDAMLRQSFVAKSSSPDALARRIGADLTKWRDIVATASSAKR